MLQFTEGCTEMVKKLAERSVIMPGEAKLTRLAKPVGRPRGQGNQGSMAVTLTLLRNLHAALLAGAGDARTASIKNQLTDAVNGLERRMGPFVNPAYTPDGNGTAGRAARGYRIVKTDGKEVLTKDIAKAAALAGLTVGSLRVALARGGGRYVRKRGAAPMQVERLLA